MVKRETNN